MRKTKLAITKAGLICILTLSVLGCKNNITLYPIEGDHIIKVSEGKSFIAPRDGYFLSNEYMKLVLEAKVK